MLFFLPTSPRFLVVVWPYLNPSPTGSTGLPGGRQFVVFISHSTGDQAWVRNTLLLPLRELQIPAVASYHFMSNHGDYDNVMIRKAMTDSCMVIIALSPSYLPSSRCVSVCACMVCVHVRVVSLCNHRLHYLY